MVLTTASTRVGSAQDQRTLELQDGSTLQIAGTSNKSDWTVDATEMEGRLWISETVDGFRPDSVSFAVQSLGLKSGRSSIMDRLMYGALKTTDYPYIVYTLGPSGVVGDTSPWQTTGTLALAGVSDTLNATVSGSEESPGRYVFTGSHRMSMKEHGIDPPTAMFGALRTREWVNINFTLVFGAGG